MSSPIPSCSGVHLAPATVLPLLSLTYTKLIPSVCSGLPLRWLAPCSRRPSLTSSLEVGHPHYIRFFPSPRLICYYSVNFMRAEGLLLCLVGCQARPPYLERCLTHSRCSSDPQTRWRHCKGHSLYTGLGLGRVVCPGGIH